MTRWRTWRRQLAAWMLGRVERRLQRIARQALDEANRHRISPSQMQSIYSRERSAPR